MSDVDDNEGGIVGGGVDGGGKRTSLGRSATKGIGRMSPESQGHSSLSGVTITHKNNSLLLNKRFVFHCQSLIPRQQPQSRDDH